MSTEDRVFWMGQSNVKMHILCMRSHFIVINNNNTYYFVDAMARLVSLSFSVFLLSVRRKELIFVFVLCCANSMGLCGLCEWNRCQKRLYLSQTRIYFFTQKRRCIHWPITRCCVSNIRSLTRVAIEGGWNRSMMIFESAETANWICEWICDDKDHSHLMINEPEYEGINGKKGNSFCESKRNDFIWYSKESKEIILSSCGSWGSSIIHLHLRWSIKCNIRRSCCWKHL